MDWIVGPVNYVFGMFDLVDMAVIFLIVVSASIYYFKTRSSPPKFNTSITSSSTPTLNGSTARADRSLLGRMKSDDRQVLILFGSQTGTAEELAGRLSKDLARYGKKPLVMDPEEIDVEDLQKLTELTDPLLLLFVATYGEGDPTDNAQELYEYFSKEDSGIDLTGLNYAVFGLGNKTYEHFNAVGKFLDKRLEELHATRIFELGLADDDGNLEEDFMRWRELFLPSISQHFGWELVNNGRIDRQYRLEIVSAPNGPIFDGEFGRVGAYAKQRPPFDQKNPYLSKIVVNRELHQGKSDRSCRHIELSIDSARMRYEAGDHVAVFPTNDSELVEKLGRLLNTDLDIVIKLINVDEDCMKKHPFPCPCKYRTALTHYVDICSPVKSHVLKALVEYTDDQSAKEYLTLLSTASDEGLREYASFVVRERRNIVDILEHFGTCKPPLDLLLEMLPRLQPRYYSISSSPKQDNSRVAITAVVLRYTIGERLVKGVCTNYLASLQEEYSVPIFTRKSTLRLPNRMHIPVIMIGPGTGLAPFRGFLHERLWHKQQGKEIAEMHLYFGCRHPEHDHIYKEEVEEFVRCGVLTQLHVAYSRVSDQKVYVQHKLWENRDVIWSLIERGGAVYVCGDARNMARDVQNVFYKIFMEVGNLDQEASQKLMKDMERQRLYQADVWS